VGSGGNGGHINILPLDATLEIGAENPHHRLKRREFEEIARFTRWHY